MTYPNATPSILSALYMPGNGHLVAFLVLIGAIRIGKVHVTLGLFHDAFYTRAPFSYDVGVVCVADIHFHGHLITLQRVDWLSYKKAWFYISSYPIMNERLTRVFQTSQ